MTIAFERVERDCPWNLRIRKEGKSRGITYDFNVIIQGEHRATWYRDVIGVGYHLHDIDGRDIPDPSRDRLPHHRCHVAEIRKQADMPAVTERLHRMGLIPTAMELEWTRLHERAWEDNRAHDEQLREIKERKERAAEDLFDALRLAVEESDRAKKQFTAMGHGWVRKAKLALVKAAKFEVVDEA